MSEAFALALAIVGLLLIAMGIYVLHDADTNGRMWGGIVIAFCGIGAFGTGVVGAVAATNDVLCAEVAFCDTTPRPPEWIDRSVTEGG